MERQDQAGLRDALLRLSEAQQAVLSESVRFTRALLAAPPAQLLATLTALLSQLTEYQAACVWQVDESVLAEPQYFGDERYQAEFERHYVDGLTGWVIESGRVQLVPAAHGCFVLLPVTAGERGYALLDLALAAGVDQVAPITLELIEIAAAHTAQAFERYRLNDWQDKVQRFLSLLPERSDIGDSGRLLQAVVEDLRSLIRVETCLVMRLDREAQALRVAAAAGLPDEFRHTAVPIGAGLSGRVAETGRPRFVEDSRQEPDVDFPWRDSHEARSITAVPLSHRGQVLGVLYVSSRHVARRLYRRDAALLELLATYVTLAWQQAAQTERLRLESRGWNLLFDALGEGALALDASQQVRRATAAAGAVFALPATALEGRGLSELFPALEAELREFFAAAESRLRTWREWSTTVGGRALRLRLEVVTDEAGAIVGFICRLRPLADSPAAPANSGELFQAILADTEQARQTADALLDAIAARARAGLNVAGQVPEAAMPAGPAPPATAHKGHILVVDDEVELAFLLRDILESAGFEVTMVNSGAAAMDAIYSNPFDLVITDLGMPLFNGWEIARATKRQGPQTPVVVVTGWGPDAERQRGRHGVDLIIPKPFQVDHVLDAVEGLLKR